MTCRYYNTEQLEPVLYLFDRVQTELLIAIDGTGASNAIFSFSTRQEPSWETLKCTSISYSESESLDERYRFTRELKVTVGGYLPFDNTDYFFMLKTREGKWLLLNYDLLPELSYEYTLSRNTDNTDITFSFLSNYPLLSSTDSVSGITEECSSYSVSDAPSRILVNEASESFLDETYGVVSTVNGAFNEISDAFNIAVKENRNDSGILTQEITFNVPLDTSKQWNMLELPSNRWSAIVERNSGGMFMLGFNGGMQALYSIDDEKVSIRLFCSTRTPMSDFDATFSASTAVFWRYIPDLAQCVGGGRARMLLQEGYDAGNNPTGYYRCLQGYEDYFVHLGYDIEGSFDTAPVMKSDACAAGDCPLRLDRLNIRFHPALTSETMTVQTNCSWEVNGITDWLSVSPVSGTGTTDVTVSSNLTGNGRADLFFVTEDGGSTRLSVISDWGGFIQDTVMVDARQQNITISASMPFSVTSAPIPYSIAGNDITISVPENTGITAVNYVFDLLASDGQETTLTIIQDRVYNYWRDVNGYICESGNTYTRQQLYVAYCSGCTAYPKEEFRKGALVAEGVDYCSGYQERWVSGGTICYNGSLYTAMKQQVSNDGVNWSYTGEMQLGNLIEANSSQCSSLIERWVITDKKTCK